MGILIYYSTALFICMKITVHLCQLIDFSAFSISDQGQRSTYDL